jgi:hypothetical protein
MEKTQYKSLKNLIRTDVAELKILARKEENELFQKIEKDMNTISNGVKQEDMLLFKIRRLKEKTE